MKFRLVYLIFFTLLVSVIFMSNKNGRAASQNAGNTGAPGDQSNANGSPRTCNYCHSGSTLTATMNIAVIDSTGAAVTQYVPGRQYTERVTINSSGAAFNGYGFQTIALKDAGNTDLDGFSDPGGNNYKISSISNGRTYAEHDNVSTSNVFEVKWTAPPAGTGPITFYAAGNGVNKNGLSSGDSGAFNVLQLNEQVAASTSDAAPGLQHAFLRPTRPSMPAGSRCTYSKAAITTSGSATCRAASFGKTTCASTAAGSNSKCRCNTGPKACTWR